MIIWVMRANDSRRLCLTQCALQWDTLRGEPIKTLATAAAMALLAVLTACGGGGGSETPAMVESPPTSQVRVIDADTVDVDGVRYRLHGIDAPEARQSCRAWAGHGTAGQPPRKR